MFKKTLQIIYSPLLTFLILFIISCEDSDNNENSDGIGNGNQEEIFSIVGTWDVYWKMGNSWENYSETWIFRENGTQTYEGSTGSYVYCSEDDVLHIDSPSTNCQCGVGGTSTLDYNGLDEFTMTDCYGNLGLYLKLKRK
tara:strand:- start:168 stop:587 length:420 start_codon:yes stop_codon:yes gene_type:complete